MSRLELIHEDKSGSGVRKAFDFFYTNKFFNKWMKKFKCGGLNYQESYYLLKKFWFEGTIACSLKINVPKEAEGQVSPFVFTPWVMAQKYNPYDFPTHARCINVRSVSYININELEIDKEIVIGWCMPNHKGVYSLIAPKLQQLIDLEMVIRICTKNQKAPWVFALNPEDKKAFQKFVDDFESDDPILVTYLNDLKNAKSLVSAAPYVIDKLEAMRQKVEDDIKTILGITNVGIAQKKEHFTDDEVQSNNLEIKESSDELLDEIQQFFDRCNQTFGTQFSIELANPQEIAYNNDEEDTEDDVNE